MKIVELEIDTLDLRYAKLRARRPALEKRLMASLEEAGQQSPVIVVAGEEPGRWVMIEGAIGAPLGSGVDQYSWRSLQSDL